LVVDEGAECVVAPRVAVGYCDISASGCRALYGLAPPDGGNFKEWALKFEGAQTASTPDDIEHCVIKLVTLFTAANAPVCSAILVLGTVPEHNESVFAAALMDFIENFAADAEVLIAAAVHLPVPVTDASKVFGVVLNDASLSVPGWTLLPTSTNIPDGLLSALLHICQARGQKAAVAAVAGHRRLGFAEALDDSTAEAVRMLGKAASAALGCKFSETPRDSALGAAGLDIANVRASDANEGIPIYV